MDFSFGVFKTPSEGENAISEGGPFRSLTLFTFSTGSGGLRAGECEDDVREPAVSEFEDEKETPLAGDLPLLLFLVFLSVLLEFFGGIMSGENLLDV